MAGLINLCTEQASHTDNVGADNPILSDSLCGLAHHKVFKNAEDEYLKSFLKFTNQLLNDPKSRAKGLMLLDTFLTQVDSSRFVTIQEPFVSALHLLAKCLDLDLSHRILVYLLPLCHKLPELSQAAVASLVPKLMTRFIENCKNAQNPPSNEEVLSVVTCLERFRGPCGSYRAQLEKVLLPFIDQDADAADFELLARIFPLLSATAGGGNKGDKYSLDWNLSVMKLLAALHDTLIQLYGNTTSSLISTDNPYEFEGSPLELPLLRSTKDVLLNISLFSRRLSNLATVLGAYLTQPFPGPKPVPLRGIMNLVGNMISVNPLNLMRNPAQEIQHLAGLIPGIQDAAFQLLGKLILSCGTQIFPEASRMEFQILQQFKWITSVPNSFHALRTTAYETLQRYLKMTRGAMTSSLNCSHLLQHILRDIRIEKHSVSLSLGVKKSKGKKVPGHGIIAASLASVGPSQSQGSQFEGNGSDNILCSAALATLELLIPSLTSDAECHRATYLLLATTVADFLQSPSPLPPGPYDRPQCRVVAFQCLLQLLLFPNFTSPVSLGLIVHLMELGTADSNPSVAFHCNQMLSIIERIIHPSSSTLEFPPIKAKLPHPSRFQSFLPHVDLGADSDSLSNLDSDSDTENIDLEVRKSAEESVVTHEQNGKSDDNPKEPLKNRIVGEEELKNKISEKTTEENSTSSFDVNSIETLGLKESMAPLIRESVAAVLKEQLGSFLSAGLSDHFKNANSNGINSNSNRRPREDEDSRENDRAKRRRPVEENSKSELGSSKALVLPEGEEGLDFGHLVHHHLNQDQDSSLRDKDLDADEASRFNYLPVWDKDADGNDGGTGTGAGLMTVEDVLLTFDDEITFSEPQIFELNSTKTFKVRMDEEGDGDEIQQVVEEGASEMLESKSKDTARLDDDAETAFSYNEVVLPPELVGFRTSPVTNSPSQKKDLEAVEAPTDMEVDSVPNPV